MWISRRELSKKALPEDDATRSGIFVYDKGIPLVLGGFVEQDVIIHMLMHRWGQLQKDRSINARLHKVNERAVAMSVEISCEVELDVVAIGLTGIAQVCNVVHVCDCSIWK